MINFHNCDNMQFMADVPDKYYDLAIVDPEYGIGRAGQTETFTKNPKHKRKHHEQKNWDNKIPSAKYFSELFRVSKNQIIWGANYFTQYLPSSMGWIFWDKGQDLTMSDGELAFTSFDVALRRKKINRGLIAKHGGSIHPTQKPVALYEWLLSKYAKPNDKIIDTHGGSGSIAIAVDKANTLDKTNYSLDIIELDKDYFDASLNRFKQYKSQTTLF